MTRCLETFTILWRGLLIEVRYERNWLGSDGPFSTAHLQVNTVKPESAPLPITETGYRSRFIDAETIAEAGGPVAFVKAWLDQAAETKSWKEQQEKARQMTLFWPRAADTKKGADRRFAPNFLARLFKR